MKRWNGWGDEATDYPLTESATGYLTEQIGEGKHIEDTELENILPRLPEPRLQVHRLVTTEPVERLRHARGQSLPDWVALRSGRIETFPDGVAYPVSDEDVRDLLDFTKANGAHLIPYGGGTSVVGHINPLPGDDPVLTLDLSRMNQLIDLDQTSRLATFGAGIAGPDLERQLKKQGYTLGHFPQSFEYSTLGGWIATRSNGQQSHFYGRIEDLFAGGHLETPIDALDLPPHPASAAGPDLRQIVLGSEGRLGVITRATVRVRPAPEAEIFNATFFRDWASGVEAVRRIAQSGLQVTMVRLNDALETRTTLALSGKDRLIRLADATLRLLSYKEERCLLLLGFVREHRSDYMAEMDVMAARDFVRSYHGLPTGTPIGEMWRKTRYKTPYLRNTLWERGYALDTLETALPWADVTATAEVIKASLRNGLAENGERVLAFAHISSVYNTGASLYVTFLFRRATDPQETLRRWQSLKQVASQEIVKRGGTISHQHGVGLDHAPYLMAEKGIVGVQMLEAVRAKLDPDGLLNPGKMLP